MYPRQSSTTHTEVLGDEASVYDWAQAQVHALNPTAACVWRLCDGATSADAIAAALHQEMGIPEAEAVVDLTLKELARLHLLELPAASRDDRPAPTRRWLLGRGLAAAMLPAVYTILTPSPLEAQSPGGAPTLSSLSPNQGNQGTTVAVTLTGTNFIVGATTVAVAGGGVTVNNVVVGGATSLTANFVLAPAAAEGPRTVTVTTAAGTSGAQAFTVTAPLSLGSPTLTSISPNQGTRGTTVAVTLTGTNFIAGATTVTVGGGGVIVTNVVVGSIASLSANFVLDPAAAEGQRTVTVTTADGTSGPRVFTILLGAPTLTSVTPNLGSQGTTVAVTLTGTNFVVGVSTVNVSGAGVTVTNVVVDSATSLTGNFVLDPAAATGARSVTVTTAAGVSGAQTFTINPPPGPGIPTLTSVSPNEGIRGTTVAVTLTGTNFVVGATTVTLSGVGVTVNSVVVGGATSLTANFVLDPAAALGPRSVTATTAGGTSSPQGFTINPLPPTLTGVSPNQGIRGETIAVTLTGTNFVAGGTTVTVSGVGITVTNVVVGSATSLTASFVLDLAAAAGARTVTVATAGGTSAGQTFTINLPAPGLQSFGFTGAAEQTFTVPAGVISILIEAVGARGGAGFPSGNPGNGGRAVARVSISPGKELTVRVGGPGQAGTAGSIAVGGFNGGGPGTGDGGGGGGGATSVRDGIVPLVVAGGGGGGGVGSTGNGGRGGHGGGLTADDGSTTIAGGQPGKGGAQSTGGAGGAGIGGASAGTAGIAGSGGSGGSNQPGLLGGGGGGGGYFGGGGGGGGTPGTGGGGGGSSFTAPGATDVLHQQGSTFGNSVIISW